MHYVIVGCGRVGSALARGLEARGHTVAIIDQEPDAFALLGEGFSGQRIRGVGFDRDTLESAGIRSAAGFAAVSSGDNTNIIAARVAREEFGLRTVVARIYDPRRAEVYERLGVATVPTVRWTTRQMMDRLLPGSSQLEFQDVSGSVTMVTSGFDASWVGTPITELEGMLTVRVGFVTRLGEGMLPQAGMRVQDGDLLHLLIETERLHAVESMLTHTKNIDEEDKL